MIALFLSFAFLASAISANKVILYALSPVMLVGVRMLIGGCILFLYTLFHKRHRLKLLSLKQDFLILLIITLTTTLIPSQLKAYALQKMVSSKMAFFGTLDPFITALYAYFFFAEKLTPKKLLGIIIGFLGACILILSSSPLEEQVKALAFISYPELAAFSSIALSRFGWLLIQKLMKANAYTPPQINTITMTLSGVISLALAFIMHATAIGALTNQAPFFSYTFFQWLGPSSTLLFFVLYTSIIGNVFGYTLYASILKQYSATFISLAGFSIPLLVSFYGWLFLGESLSLLFFISCTITFIGLWIFFLDERSTLVEKQIQTGPVHESLE